MEQQSMKDMFKLEFGEEVANCVTHGVMALLCLFALPCVAVYGYIQAGMLKAIGDAIFVISLFSDVYRFYAVSFHAIWHNT